MASGSRRAGGPERGLTRSWLTRRTTSGGYEGTSDGGGYGVPSRPRGVTVVEGGDGEGPRDSTNSCTETGAVWSVSSAGSAQDGVQEVDIEI